jgi:hypothetical protein
MARRIKTAFGDADRIRIAAEDSVRTYDVLDNGALATSVYAGHNGQQLVNNWSVAILETVPRDIFSEASLGRSAVPLAFQSPPARNSQAKHNVQGASLLAPAS